MTGKSEGVSVRLLVCDLDGTLLRANSFRWWVIYWTFTGLVHPQFWWRWCAVPLKRLSRRIGREEMKAELMAVYTDYEQRLPLTLRRAFSRLLLLMARKDVAEFLGQKQSEGFVGVLATAAPYLYLTEIIRRYGFCWAVGSYLEAGTLVETIGATKSRAVMTVIEAQGVSREECFIIAVTDHSDDLPMAFEVDHTVLVKPSRVTSQYFEQAGVSFEYFRKRSGIGG